MQGTYLRLFPAPNRMARSQEKQPTKGIAMRRMLTFVAVSLVLLGLFSWPAMAAGDTVGVFVSATNYTLLKMPSGPNRTFHHGFTSGYPWDNIPFVCDFDGDGDDSIGYYSQVDGRFYIANKNQARVIDTIITYAPVSNPTGKLWPVVRRNNGATQVGVFDQATNWWYLKNGPSFQWGWGTYTGLIPVVGDWNGDGIFTVGLYNPTLQKFRLNNNLPPSGTGMTITFGAPGAHPVIGDWNGDGLDDVGYYDLAAGVFHRNGYANVDFNYAILNEFKAPLPDNGYLQMYPVAGKWDASGELDLAPYSWDMTPPGDCQGMNCATLDTAVAQGADSEHQHLHSLLIARNGKLVREAYYNGYSQFDTNNLWSASKSILSALYGVAGRLGYIHDYNPADPINWMKSIPMNEQLSGYTFDSSIKLKHMLTMAAGLDWIPNWGGQPSMLSSPDWVGYVVGKTFVPINLGAYNYSNGLTHTGCEILRRYTSAAFADTYEFAKQTFFTPLGILPTR
jgi:hypothetical protein